MDDPLVDRLKSQAKLHFRSAKSGLLILCLAFAWACINALAMNLSPLIERQIHAIEAQTGGEVGEFVLTANFSAIVGQSIVPLIWSTFARRSLLWRVSILFLFSLPQFWLIAVGNSTPLRQLELLPPLVIAAMLPIFIYRYIGGWEITNVDSQTVGGARQINISDLATTMLFTAITIASLQHYQSGINPNQLFAGIVVALMWVGATTILALTSCIVLPLLHLLMDSPSRRRRAISYGIIAIAAATTTFGFSYETGLLRACAITLCLITPIALMAIASVCALRRMGYRLRQHSRQRSVCSKTLD